MKKRVFAATLAAVMMLSMAGCSGEDSEKRNRR